MTLNQMTDNEPLSFKEDAANMLSRIDRQVKSSKAGAVGRFFLGFGFVVICGLTVWPFLPHRYDAVTTIILRSRNDTGGIDHAVALRQPLDDGAVQSELDVMASLPLAQKLVTDYHLGDDPELAPRHKNGFIAALKQLGYAPSNLAQDPSRILQDHLIVSRDKRSYTVRLGYWSEDPEKAAQWANALVSAYFNRQIEIRKAEADRRADRIRTRMLDLAERAYDLRSMALLDQTDTWTKASLTDERNSVINEFAMTRKTLVDALQVLPQANADAELVADAVAPLTATFPNPLLMAVAVLGLATLSGLGLVWGLTPAPVQVRSVREIGHERANDD